VVREDARAFDEVDALTYQAIWKNKPINTPIHIACSKAFRLEYAPMKRPPQQPTKNFQKGEAHSSGFSLFLSKI